MALYINQTGKLKEVKEKPFKLEKDIQKVFEENLSAIMGLVLVKSEFTIKNKRIDTLAYDPQACAFIIIEYKREKKISVVDQGFTYLSLMLENKADFIVEYNESLRQNMKREDVDWSQTRVAFVSTNSITQGDQPSILWQMLNQYNGHFYISKHFPKFLNCML
jgi:hypothetical protein